MTLKRLIFDRSELLPDSFLEGIASRYEGKKVSLNDINAIVGDVDREYKDRGYFAAKAYVPNQDVRDGILEISLIEGKIDKITVKENKSTSENFVRKNLGVESGDRLNVKELQDNILMFNAANDIKARIAMEPGEKFAATDLDVIVEKTERVSVSAFADNAGQKSTGIYRAGAFVSVRSLTGYRDNLNFGGVVTEGSNALFGSFDIPEPVFGSRIGFGADYSDTEIVGGDLKALDVTGNFYNYYFYIKRPVYVTDSFVNNLNFTTSFKNGASYIGDFRTQKVYTDTMSLSWDSLKLFAGGYLYNQLSVTKGAKLFDGTDDAALKIQTSGGDDSALTALANNNINLIQENGDLGLASVTSLDGDVNIKVENGGVFDANTNEVYDDKTVEQLTKIWDDMGLDVGNEQMKEAFLSGKKAEYNAYWQYKSRQPEGSEPEFKFTAAEREALLNKELNESEKQALGMDKITDEYINQLEAGKTAEYKKLAAVYGDESKYGSSYDANWTYQLSGAEETELAEGAGWNKSQLAYSIFKAKEGEVVDTQYMIEDPNVVGKNVTIEANGLIGRDTGSETFKLSELSPETDVDKILLIASAERDNLEISEDGDTVTVHKREDVDIHADSITLKAKDYIYLGGEEDININTVEAGEGQKITIAGAKGIYNVATEADHTNVIGGDLTLEAADGSIGTADKALNVKLAEGSKIVARSQNDIFLNSTGGSLVADSLLAKDGILNLTTNGNLIAGTLDEGDMVNLQGQSIVINAANIGDEDNYLTIALGDKEGEEHTLTLNAEGDANINNLGMQELSVKSAAAGGTLRLKSASSITGAAADSLLSAAKIEFNGIAGNIGSADQYLKVATDALTAAADGSIYLDNAHSSVFSDVNAGEDIRIISAADIALTDVAAGGDIEVESADSLDADNLTSGGNLQLTAEKDIKLTTADAGGSLTADAAGNLTAKDMSAGTTMNIASDSVELDEVTSGGDMKVVVNNDNIFGALTSKEGNIDLTVNKSDANLHGSVKAANGQVTVVADGSILNAGAPKEGAIIANTVDLTANKGSIGTSNNYLTVDSSYTKPGWINALAEKGIYINEVNGDMNIRQFASNGDIDMRVDSSILAAPGLDPNVPNFKADNITLHTNGSIGAPDNRLVLALNDNGHGKINLKAENGIAVNKLEEGLVSDYIYNLQSGKVMIDLPSGHANIARVTAVGGFELYIHEHTNFYNIWLTRSDLEARMMNPPYTEYPTENPIEIMRAPLLDRYKLRTDEGLFMNIGSLTGEEEKLSVGF